MMDLAAFQLLRLASPALPIGAYSYSQGMESAIEFGVVKDSATACDWIAAQLAGPIAQWEGPQLWAALQADTVEALTALNERWLASRETRELHAETIQTGYSLEQLLRGLPGFAPALWPATPGLPVAWALAARQWQIAPQAALQAYLWSWCENQIMVLMKALPMGQQAGQILQGELLPQIASATQQAMTIAQDDGSAFAPGLAFYSARHETQYSRLFRS